MLGAANWSYISPHSGLYDYLFGPYGLVTVLQNSSNALSAVNGVFSSPAAYNVAVAAFAILIGLLVYVFLEGMDHIAADTTGALHEAAYVSDAAAQKTLKHEVKLRAGLRLITLLIWICYLIFFARVIVPFCIIVARIGNTQLLSADTIISVLSGALVLFLAFHVHTIFMRLLVLRPRLFGGENVVVGRGGHEE